METALSPESVVAGYAWERLRDRLALEAVESWDREQPSGWCFGRWIWCHALEKLHGIATDLT